MEIVATVVLIVAIAIMVAVAVVGNRLARQVRDLRAATAEVCEQIDSAPADLVALMGQGPRQVISVEILNPFELAAQQSKMTKPVSALTPNLLRNIVYNQATKQVRQQLTKMGVVADVRRHRAGG